MDRNIESVQTKIDYRFQDRRWCIEALTTAGIFYSGNFDGNALLALIGDSILRVDISLRSHELGETKGDASERMQTAASNETLARMFDMADLGPDVNVNPAQRGKISLKTKATVVEALFGAVFRDSKDIEAARAVILRLRDG